MVVSHGSISTAYAHMSRIAVSVGQSVGRGSVLGAVGCTGHCFGAHLHFEVRVGGVPQNPVNYLVGPDLRRRGGPQPPRPASGR